MATERWEVVERCVLLAVGTALVALAVWFAAHGAGAEVALGLMFIAPIAFWVAWQMLYEDKRESPEPPSKGERVMHATGLWTRRIAFGAMAGLFAFGCAAALLWDEEAGAAMAGLSLFILLGWAAFHGAGRHRSLKQALRVRRQRDERYARR